MIRPISASGYGHPDHIQAHRITLATAEMGGVPSKLCYTAVPRERVAELFEYLRSSGSAPEDLARPLPMAGAGRDGGIIEGVPAQDGQHRGFPVPGGA